MAATAEQMTTETPDLGFPKPPQRVRKARKAVDEHERTLYAVQAQQREDEKRRSELSRELESLKADEKECLKHLALATGARVNEAQSALDQNRGRQLVLTDELHQLNDTAAARAEIVDQMLAEAPGVERQADAAEAAYFRNWWQGVEPQLRAQLQEAFVRYAAHLRVAHTVSLGHETAFAKNEVLNVHQLVPAIDELTAQLRAQALEALK